MLGLTSSTLLLIMSTIMIFSNIQEKSERNKVKEDLFSALKAEERSKDIPESEDIYGWLLGNWDLDGTLYGENGIERTFKTEIRLSRILEGRATQDIFVTPPISDRSLNAQYKPGDGFGTTIRYYDKKISAWHVIWIDPTNNKITKLIGRRIGNEIVHEGETSEGSKIRWTFKDITPTTFRWTGEILQSDGKTWKLRLQYIGKKN